MDYYFGGIGKDNSWPLAADSPVVIFDKEKQQFIGLKSIQEAAPYYESDARYEVYVWSDGVWQRLQFLVLSAKPSGALGFQPASPGRPIQYTLPDSN